MRLSVLSKIRGSVAVIAATALIGSVVGVANAAVRVNEAHTALASAARPTQQPSATPRPTASPTPTGAPSPPAAISCAYPTVSFDGSAYCPATLDAVRSTVYGIGSRVVLRNVTVTAVTAGTVTVAVWALPPCVPGKYCGQLLTLQSLTVAWTGTARPAYGDVLDLFGRTIPTSLTPVGYITTGWCPIDWC